MFRNMRRIGQLLSDEESKQILAEATHGVLGLSGDDGYPYTVPVSHVYRDGKIFFHCAKEGHKIDAIRRNKKVSFCVVAQDEVMPKERTTAYISVIAFGTARIVEDEPGLRRIAAALSRAVEPFTLQLPFYLQETYSIRAVRLRLSPQKHLTPAFAGEMLHCDFYAEHLVCGDDLIDLRLTFLRVIPGVFLSDHGCDPAQARLVSNDPGCSKGDHTDVGGGPLFGHDLILSDDAEGYLIVPADRIDLVSLLRAVEKDLSVAVDMAHRDGVWITVVSAQAEDAVRCLGQD